MSNPLLGAMAGAAGGLAGSWAMVRFQHAIKVNGWDGDGGHHQHHRRNALPNDTDGTLPDEPASMQVASAVSNALTGQPLDEPTKQDAGS
ncbi:MAG: hypothetical protein LC753_05560, partial [Acidobacteria bacterium]|nr:hypothetical protein [Acidobacteriota bacterium]